MTIVAYMVDVKKYGGEIIIGHTPVHRGVILLCPRHRRRSARRSLRRAGRRVGRSWRGPLLVLLHDVITLTHPAQFRGNRIQTRPPSSSLRIPGWKGPILAAFARRPAGPPALFRVMVSVKERRVLGIDISLC